MTLMLEFYIYVNHFDDFDRIIWFLSLLADKRLFFWTILDKYFIIFLLFKIIFSKRIKKQKYLSEKITFRKTLGSSVFFSVLENFVTLV